MKIVMYCKDNDITRIAIDYLKLRFNDVLVNPHLTHIRCDYLFSFLNGKIFTKEEIHLARHAINWHTAPPAYPGTGGYSRAFYNDDWQFGITCHYMDEKIDHGEIIDVEYFEINPANTIDKLLRLSHIKALKHFIGFIDLIVNRPKWERDTDYKRESMYEINKELPAAYFKIGEENDNSSEL